MYNCCLLWLQYMTVIDHGEPTPYVYVCRPCHDPKANLAARTRYLVPTSYSWFRRLLQLPPLAVQLLSVLDTTLHLRQALYGFTSGHVHEKPALCTALVSFEGQDRVSNSR